MKIETKEIYKCEYCNKLYQIKSYCVNHERSCSKNPLNNRACFGCKHLSIKQGTSCEYSYSPERTVELLHCDKQDTFLYPPKVEHKKNWIVTDGENNPMPITCELYEDPSYENIF